MTESATVKALDKAFRIILRAMSDASDATWYAKRGSPKAVEAAEQTEHTVEIAKLLVAQALEAARAADHRAHNNREE
jgi:hypothetical protein